MGVLLEPRHAAPVTVSSTVTPVFPSLMPFAQSTSTSDPTNKSKISPGTLALAIIAPILFVLVLVFLILFARRRMQAARQNSATSGTSAGTTTTTSTANNNDNTTSESRRDIRRARRLRRTDSGGTVKTLPEYNELGEDEILLSKSIEAPSLVSRNASGSRQASSHPREESNESLSRTSSLTAILRRLSLRRTEPEPPIEDESNEMEDMIERATLSSLTEDVNEQRMSPLREERNLPSDDTPEYDQLYPTLPPQIQVYDDGDLENQASFNNYTAPYSSLTGRRPARGLRNMFRRQATSMDTIPQRISSSSELGLTQTVSNDYSLYRPSTSSSRSIPYGGSSISLISQNGNDSNDNSNTLPRRSHLRNISAPISTRRLKLAPPVAGFSDQQMQFLTSVESLDKYGVPVNGAVEEQEKPPPSFERLAREEEERLQQPSRHLAPILTSAEIAARSEQSPLSPTLLSQRSLAEVHEEITTIAAATAAADDSNQP